MRYLKTNQNTLFKHIRKTLSVTAIICSSLFAVPYALAEDAEPAQAVEQTATQATSSVNINTATASELASGLKNVGAKKAEVIVTYREEYGPFTKAEQLMEVPGIGPKLFEINKDRIKVE